MPGPTGSSRRYDMFRLELFEQATKAGHCLQGDIRVAAVYGAVKVGYCRHCVSIC